MVCRNLIHILNINTTSATIETVIRRGRLSRSTRIVNVTTERDTLPRRRAKKRHGAGTRRQRERHEVISCRQRGEAGSALGNTVPATKELTVFCPR